MENFETETTENSDEFAQDEFDRILKAARVKWDKYCLFSGQKDAESEKELIIDAIKEGVITVSDEGFPTVHTEHQNKQLSKISIVRRPVRGDKLAMDRVKDGHMVSKEDSILGKFLGISPAALQQLEERDYSLISTLWYLFLGY